MMHDCPSPSSCSYYTDPYLYNCKYDPVQNAVYIAESRAIAYAISKNVIVVSAGAYAIIRNSTWVMGSFCVR